MSASVFIDGQTRAGYIAAVPGLHGALRFGFRPMTFEQVELAEDALGKQKTVPKRVAVVQGIIATQLTDWDAVDANGSETRHGSPAVLSKLHPLVVNRLYAILTGRQASDPLPDGERSDDEHDAYVTELFEAANGKNLQVETEKNSDSA
jgi:hypothetical protein